MSNEQETYHQMTERHRNEIEALQEACEHEVVEDVQYVQSIRQEPHAVPQCQLCGKLFHKEPEFRVVEWKDGKPFRKVII